MMTLVILSWLTFFIPHHSEQHDRIAYAVTLMLTVMAVNFITAEHRPATNESMWLDTFQTNAFIMVFFPLVETVFLYRIEALLEGEEDKGGAQSDASDSSDAEDA